MKYKQSMELLETIREAIEYLETTDSKKTFEDQVYLLEDIVQGMQNINQEIFFSYNVNGFNLSEMVNAVETTKEIAPFIKCVKEWCKFISATVENFREQSNELDERFAWLMAYVKYVDAKELVEHIKARLMSQDEQQQQTINVFYQNHAYFWGTLDCKNEKYDVIYDRVNMLTGHREDFIWLYHNLGDYRSKLVLVNMLYNWISFDPTYIRDMHENNFKDYYDLDLLSCGKDDVIVDIGAYTGDSALDYINTYRKYKKIYCYEITPDSIAIMKKNLQDYEDVEIVNKGLGAEKDALRGCVRHVKEDRPKLLICVYHNNSDIFEIPKMIREMRDDYKFYLRSNGMQWAPAEIVLFAL